MSLPTPSTPLPDDDGSVSNQHHANAEILESRTLADRWIAFFFQPKVALPTIVVLCLLTAPLVWRGIKLSRVPDRDEPFDTKAVLEFKVPDAENAFVEYQAASAKWVKFLGKGEELDKTLDEGWEQASESVRRWLDDSRAFMELWRQGTAKPDAQFGTTSELTIFTALPSVQESRDFARLVQLESSRLRSEGMLDEAWAWLQTGFRTSRQLGRHGVIIERLVGIAIHSMIADESIKWASDPRVTEGQLRHAADEFEHEQKRTPSLSACLKVEYLLLTKTMQTEPPHRLITGVGLIAGSRSYSSPPLWLTGTWLFLNGEPALGERVARHVFASWLAQADKPRSLRTKQEPVFGLFEPDPTLAGRQPTATEIRLFFQESPLAKLLIPACQNVFVAVDREAARGAILQTIFALERHKRKHGRYPDVLADLVPEYLSAVPEDVFASASTPLIYRRDGDGAMLYSVGENGVDDGGKFDGAVDIGSRIGPKAPAP